MTGQADFVQPPRIANWLVHLFAAGEAGEALVGDMLEEFSYLASKSGAAEARSWYWRQARRTITHLVANTWRVAPWWTTATVVGGLLLNRLVSPLPERAIFAVLHRYQVYDHHFAAYLFLATDGIAIGHVIASLVVGSVVGLAARRREMVATMTLSLVLCAMFGVAVLLWMCRGQALILGMLAWNAADWLAIVAGGAIIRMCRSAATNLPSAT
jgi:hypothetical protein